MSGYTKLDIVKKAFGRLGLAAFLYSLTPDQLYNAVQDLEDMMADWEAKGIRLSYNISDDRQNINIEQDSGLYPGSYAGIIDNFAIKIAGNYGKIVPPDVTLCANNFMSDLLKLGTRPVPKQRPKYFPSGAGNRLWWVGQPWLVPEDTNSLQVENNGTLEFE